MHGFTPYRAIFYVTHPGILAHSVPLSTQRLTFILTILFNNWHLKQKCQEKYKAVLKFPNQEENPPKFQIRFKIKLCNVNAAQLRPNTVLPGQGKMIKNKYLAGSEKYYYEWVDL